MYFHLICATVIITLLPENEGKKFNTNCELVDALRPYNMPGDLPNCKFFSEMKAQILLEHVFNFKFLRHFRGLPNNMGK
jgi:hypothetical protein